MCISKLNQTLVLHYVIDRQHQRSNSVIKLQQHSRYSSGNLVFASPRVLLSPSSNRVLKIDLVKHITTTLPFSARSDIVFITYSPHTKFLLVVSSDSRVILADIRGVVFRRLNFSSKNTNSPLIATFSPSGKHVLISVNNKIHLYSIHSPLRPLDLVRVYSGHYAPVTSLCFSPDGKFFASGSFDSTVRIYSTSPIEHFRPITLSSHKTPIVSLSFNTNTSLYTVSRDGSFFIWSWPSSSDPLSLKRKHYLQLDHSTIRSCAFTENLLGIGFDSGVFSLYALDGDDVNRIHHLSVSSNTIDTINLNQDGTYCSPSRLCV